MDPFGYGVTERLRLAPITADNAAHVDAAIPGACRCSLSAPGTAQYRWLYRVPDTVALARRDADIGRVRAAPSRALDSPGTRLGSVPAQRGPLAGSATKSEMTGARQGLRPAELPSTRPGRAA
jgi:hypothetical protein